jgi:hypothetical protein
VSTAQPSEYHSDESCESVCVAVDVGEAAPVVGVPVVVVPVVVVPVVVVPVVVVPGMTGLRAAPVVVAVAVAVVAVTVLDAQPAEVPLYMYSEMYHD